MSISRFAAVRARLPAMPSDIKPIDPVGRSFFAGEVSGIDLTRPLSPQEVEAVHAGMDRFGVLVFHDQKIDDEQQLAFSRSLGPLEQATGDIAAPAGPPGQHGAERHLQPRQEQQGAGARRPPPPVRARQPALALRQLVQGRAGQVFAAVGAADPADAGGNTEFADMRAAYDALDDKTRREVHDLICQHSQIFSRGILGFTDFTDAERVKWAPVRQRLVRSHPRTRPPVALSLEPCRRHRRLAGARGARLPARPHRACDAAPVRLRPSSGSRTTW